MPNSTLRDEIVIQHYRKLYDLFLSNKMCDVVLVTEDEVNIQAHKIVLASASSFFDVLFNGTFKENIENVFHIKEINSNILRSIVTYMYTFELDLNEENIKDIYYASNYFNLEFAQKLCNNFIINNISKGNCVQFMESAKVLQDDNLFQYCMQYIIKNFVCIMYSEYDYQTLSKTNLEFIKEIVSNDSLKVDSEKLVFDFIVQWVEYDKENRAEYLSSLLKFLRIDWLSHKDLKQIYNTPLIKEFKQNLVNFTDDVMAVKCFLDGPKTKSRICLNRKKIIYVIRDEPIAKSFSEYININLEEEWKKNKGLFLCPLRKQSKIVVVEDKYVMSIGGLNKIGSVSTAVDLVQLYSNDSKWKSITPLNDITELFDCCTSKECVFVIPEYQSNCYTNQKLYIERYDFSTKVWTNITQVPSDRRRSRTICYNDNLYIFGGIEFRSGVSSKVEKFDVEKSAWTQLKFMPVPLYSMGIVLKGNNVYIIGGRSILHSAVRSAYKFDLENYLWTKLSDMIFPRSRANAIIIDECIFVFGDEDGKVLDCELYDIVKNKWTLVNSATMLHPYNNGNAILLNYGILSYHLNQTNT